LFESNLGGGGSTQTQQGAPTRKPETPPRWIIFTALWLALAVWSFLDIDRAWFQAYGACLIVLVAVFSWTRSRRVLWGGSAASAWAFLVVATFTFVAQSYWVELHRQLSQGFHADGVELPVRADSALRIGVGDGLDVRFAPGADSLDEWRMVIRRAPEGFAVDSIAGVEILQQRSHHWLAGFWDVAMRYDPSWVDKSGAELVADGSEAVARSNAAATHTFRIIRDGNTLALDWNGVARAPLVPGGSSLTSAQRAAAERLKRALRTGLPLRSLAWNSIPDTAAARHLVLVMRYLPPDNGSWIGFVHPLRPPTFRLAAADDRWTVSGRDSSAAPIVLAPNDTVRLVAHGEHWAFALENRRVSENQRPAVAVRFVRAPRSLLAWMPPASICAPAERCTLVSSTRLPPTIPHFDLSRFGLDTARYSVLGRVTMLPDSIIFRTASRVFSAPYDVTFAVPAKTADVRSSAAYLFRVTRVAQGKFNSLVATLLAMLLATFVFARLVARSPAAKARLMADSIEARTAWALANILTVLFGIRLVLGFRVSYAAPYHPRGADSAIGLWLATVALTALLLLWKSWVPLLVAGLQRLEALLMRRTAPAWPAVPALGGASFEVVLPACIALALLIYLRPAALRGAGFVVAALALIWAFLEYLRADVGQTSGTPASALGAPPIARPWWLYTLPVAALLVALSAVSRITGGLMVIVSLVFIAPLCWALGAFAPPVFRRALNVATGGRGVWLVLLLFLTAADLILFMLQVASPTVLFAALVFLFLLAVRLGRWVGSIAWLDGANVAKLLAYGVLLAGAFIATTADVGLGLVFGLPLMLTFVVAVGIDRIGAWGRVGLAALVVGSTLLAIPVLQPEMPPMDTLDPAGASRAFDELGGPLRKFAPARAAVAHAVVRGLAGRHAGDLERLLPLASPSPAREEIVPALEQIWGGRAYSAGRNYGEGLASPTVIGRGVPEPVSDAENTFAVYVMAEHGFYGALVVLGLYMMLNIAVLPLLFAMRRKAVAASGDNGAVAMTVGGILAITIPALYVAASNIGVVPLTGQNMPILGLNAWSDVLLSSALVSAVLAVLFTSNAHEEPNA
jgi:hypothetical protein